MKCYEFFDHTADIGIRIFGNSTAQLFEHAGLALFDIITDISTVREKEKRSIAIRRDSIDELLVEWLSRLLYLNATELFLFRRFHILDMDNQSLTAEAWGELLQENIHRIKTEVKAITYHNLQVYQENGLWTATVVLDI